MSVQFAIPAAATLAANGHGEAHSTADLQGPDARQHRRRLWRHRHQPALRAARSDGCRQRDFGRSLPQAVLGVLSLILWALIIVVTLKYVVILLRADNNGEGGTLALMALAQRAVSKGGGAIVLLGIISGALFYGDAVITPALSVLSAIEGIKLVTAPSNIMSCR